MRRKCGKGNKLLSRYFHDSSFSLELQDALFNLEYIALNTGAQVEEGDEGILYEEQITSDSTTAGKLTASGTPVDFFGEGTIGWIALPGSEDWEKFTFTSGSTATGVTVNGSVIPVNTKYCIKYMKDADYDQVIVPADIVPDEVTVILKGDLYKAGKSDDVSTSSVIGHIEILVPRLQMNGSMDIALNSSGAAQIPLSGSALATTDDTAGCESGGYYAVVKKYEDGTVWYNNLVGMALEKTDVLTTSTTVPYPLHVYGVFKNGSSKLLDNSKLTFTADGCTVTNGVITAIASAGSITVAPTTIGTTGSDVRLVVTIESA